MKINKLTIQNFRSIEMVRELEMKGLSTFVGQNNHGKTNFFEAIEWFFVGSGELNDICFMRDRTKEVSVEIEFVGLQKALSFITNSTQQKAITNIFDKEDSILIRRNSCYKDGQDRQLFNPKTNEWENPLGRDSSWKQFLPTLEYVSTKKFLDDVAKYGKATPISKMLSAVLEAMLEVDPSYAEFKNIFNELFGDPTDPTKKTQVRESIDKIGGTVAAFLQKQFPDCEDVKFKVENPEIEELFKKFKTSVNDGIENDSSEKGDGMQRALMLAIIQAYANFRRDNGESKDFLFLIDEAELHLHPTAQRALKNALLDVALTGDQVLINTHSSVFIADDKENQRIFKVEKTNKITDIRLVNEDEKPMVIFELLGGSPTDLLLPSNIVIVEGYSEVTFLRNIIKRFYFEEYKDIQIVPANGDLTKQEKSTTFMDIAYEHFKSKSNPYSDKVILIADACSGASGEQEKYDKFKESHKELIEDQRYFELPCGSLEEYYPGPYKSDPKVIKDQPGGKNLYADKVSSVIEIEQFEDNMEVLYLAIQKAKEKSFGNN